MLEHDIFVVVCDAQRAHVYQNIGSKQSPSLSFVAGFEQKLLPTHEQGTDKPGTTFSSASKTRSYVAQSDYHEAQQHAFSKNVVKEMANLLTSKNIKKIIWVAPPRMLSFLRADMPKQLKDITAAEIDKDLTKHPKEKIIELLNYDH